MNISVPSNSVMEYINNVEISPLISKGYCKVCYVGQEPNRNGTVITKEVATEMGRKLPGSPVVGYYNKEDEDFEGHNREIILQNGKFEVLDVTKAYGFVPTDSDVWFEKFLDGDVEHEYLCCTVYIWTGAYPESKRILEKGNNQSMELTKDTGFWANDDKTNGRIFIYNDALIEKLCILGENVEPCFEGAQIKKNFSLESSPEFQEFKATMFSMLNELKETLGKGGNSRVFTEYAIEIGCGLWDQLYAHLEETYPNVECDYPCSLYGIRGIYEEGGSKFAIIAERSTGTLYRLNLSIINDNVEFSEELIEVKEVFTPVQFSLEDIEAYEAARYAKKPEEEEEEKKKEEEEDDKGDEQEDKEEEDDEEKKKKYNLEEVVEYAELSQKYETLQNDYAALQSENKSLKTFKLQVERVNKQSMIDSFFMLSDEDKKEIVDNMDNYSLEDIEAKLSVICFRKKLSFGVEENAEKKETANQGLFQLQNFEDTKDVPAWVLAVRENNKM